MAHRTSNMVDRLMNHQDRLLYTMQYFHGNKESARLYLPLALGQIPFFSSPRENQTQVTPWWDISKARRCGKLWCSEVAFPYFPHGKFLEKFTLAVEPEPEQDLTQVTSEIEERAFTYLLSLRVNVTGNTSFECRIREL